MGGVSCFCDFLDWKIRCGLHEIKITSIDLVIVISYLPHAHRIQLSMCKQFHLMKVFCLHLSIDDLHAKTTVRSVAAACGSTG